MNKYFNPILNAATKPSATNTTLCQRALQASKAPLFISLKPAAFTLTGELPCSLIMKQGK